MKMSEQEIQAIVNTMVGVASRIIDRVGTEKATPVFSSILVKDGGWDIEEADRFAEAVVASFRNRLAIEG